MILKNGRKSIDDFEKHVDDDTSGEPILPKIWEIVHNQKTLKSE